MTVITLDELSDGQDGVILLLNINDQLLPRLAALGVKVGKTIRMLRRASRKGPLHIRVDTTEMMLRQSEAQYIQLKIKEPLED